jgi:sugar lactone lactonase YvrE
MFMPFVRLCVLSFLSVFTCQSLRAEESVITTIAGTGKTADAGSDSGLGIETNVGQPFGVELGPDGALYICEVQNHRVRRLDLKTGRITSVAGSGKKGYSGDGGPATEAMLNEPYEVRFDTEGNLFFVEMQNHLIRRVDRKSGIISTVAGTGRAGYSGDGGPATEAELRTPHSIAFDDAGRLYVADIGNHRIRRIDLQQNKIDTIAGNGIRKLAEEGQRAAGNPLLGPRALTIEGDTLWIALREGHSVWKMNLKEGVLHRIAGTGKSGYAGDGHAALQATFNGPKGIAIGPDKSVYVVDTENQAIRRIDTRSGKISTIAGSEPAHRGAAGDGGPAIRAELNRPHGICIGADGTIYIGDTENHRVRKVAKE